MFMTSQLKTQVFSKPGFAFFIHSKIRHFFLWILIWNVTTSILQELNLWNAHLDALNESKTKSNVIHMQVSF